MLTLLKKFILLIGIISFSSCGKLPVKPSIDSGILIKEANEAFFVNNQTSEEYSHPIIVGCELHPNLDKNIIHDNKDWNKVLLYIRLLENAAPKKIRKQLLKIRRSSRILQEKHVL
mgnify:FL=1|tara:strand:+ start:521 stop:868 length:348 start_codon:yes stop_codon:yes gene_type:complete